jgi:hypothetical protein
MPRSVSSAPPGAFGFGVALGFRIARSVVPTFLVDGRALPMAYIGRPAGPDAADFSMTEKRL